MTADGGPRPRRIAERELVFLLGAISATTALVVAYAGYGAISLAFALWARRHRLPTAITGPGTER
ncbi:hypothetical protein [Candidatus Poriferisodalis sp.]|uniref:hypothetical protein n=1 Tax=Candidatus Poriferisodalis sp. TaxID=3101277 RepID=UPI003AF762C5